MKQQGNITAAPITTRPRHHWPRVFPVFCVRPLPVGRNACFWSRSADRTEVSFLREIDGGFREELRAAQGRTSPFALENSPASVVAWLVS